MISLIEAHSAMVKGYGRGMRWSSVLLESQIVSSDAINAIDPLLGDQNVTCS